MAFTGCVIAETREKCIPCSLVVSTGRLDERLCCWGGAARQAKKAPQNILFPYALPLTPVKVPMVKKFWKQGVKTCSP
jgi:hypothetical protein